MHGLFAQTYQKLSSNGLDLAELKPKPADQSWLAPKAAFFKGWFNTNFENLCTAISAFGEANCTGLYVNSGRESSEDARWTRMHVLYQ